MSQAFTSTSRVTENDFERLKLAAEILNQEAKTIFQLAKNVPLGIADAVELMLGCTGAVVVTGMGKAGWIGQKISASLASTGTYSHFLHPAEAVHGDLGRVRQNDLILALSNSGETEELTRILPSLKKKAAGIIAITAHSNSTLGKSADVVVDFGRTREACHLGLAPSNSTVAMLALGDALALVVSQSRRFNMMDFAQYHPGGSLGKKLSTVNEVMRPIDKCRVAHEDEKVRDIYVRSSISQRRVGVVLVINSSGALTGIFTDSDLARLLERRQESSLDAPIRLSMTRNPISIQTGEMAEEAVKVLASRNISELPVIDETCKPLGIIDITDLISFFPVPAT